MAKPSSFRDVIDLWPTREAFAAEIGTNAPRVSKWRQRDNIPAEFWQDVLAAPKVRAAGIRAETLASFAARNLEAAQ